MVDKLPNRMTREDFSNSIAGDCLDIRVEADDTREPYTGIPDLPAQDGETTKLYITVVEGEVRENPPQDLSPSGNYTQNRYTEEATGTYFPSGTQNAVIDYPSGTEPSGPYDDGDILLRTSGGRLSDLKVNLIESDFPVEVEFEATDEHIVAEIEAYDPNNKVCSDSIEIQLSPDD